MSAARLANRCFVAAFCLVPLGTMLVAPARAQNVDAEVRKSLVFLEMTGLTDNGIPIGSRGTGFFVSADGHILTSRHLLDPLNKVKPETLVINIHVWGRKSAADANAFILDERANLDLLLLKARRLQNPYVPLKIGSARRDLTDKNVSTIRHSGFRYQDSPPDAIYGKFIDQITSDDGPAGYTWVLGGTVAAGQSGSPVYTDDGTVVGILKGTFGQQTVFVPIENAATLLLPLLLQSPGTSGATNK